MHSWFKQPLKEPKDKLLAFIGAAFFLGLVIMLFQGGTPGAQLVSKEALPSAANQTDNSMRIQRGSELSAQERLLEERVASALSRISGVGSTDVRISLAQGTQAEYAINTNAGTRKIEEKDKQGGTRITADNTDSRQVVILKEGGTTREQPVVVKEMRYQVAGVLIVAEGAKDPVVKENIGRAVRTLLDIPAHKISIFAREGHK